MRIRISYKITPIAVLGILLVGLIAGFIFVQNQNVTANNANVEDIQSAKAAYDNLIAGEINALEVGVTNFFNFEAAKQLFIAGDRTKLYELLKPLYDQNLALGLTHFVLFRPDDTIFLRVHDNTKFDDSALSRGTYNKAKASNSWGTGLDAGKVAYALRAVHPYYNNGQLIGYVEYGRDINPFFDVLKKQTGDEFVVVAKKEFIKAADWKSVTDKKGIRYNYDDHKNYVVINSTDPKFNDLKENCWNETSISNLPTGGKVLNQYTENGKTYVCSAFNFMDAAGNQAGSIVTVKDITAQSAIAKLTIQKFITVLLVVAFIIALLLIIVLNLVVISPLKKLNNASQQIFDGNLDAQLPQINTNDEIKDMSDTLEQVVGALKYYKSQK